MNNMCLIGLLPFLYTAIFNQSIIATIVAVNGICYHCDNSNRLFRYWDIVFNCGLIIFTVYNKIRTLVIVPVAILVWVLNNTYPSRYENFIHVIGVTWVLYIGHLDYLDLLAI